MNFIIYVLLPWGLSAGAPCAAEGSTAIWLICSARNPKTLSQQLVRWFLLQISRGWAWPSSPLSRFWVCCSRASSPVPAGPQ